MPDIETVSFQLDLSAEKEEKKRRMSMRKLSKNVKEETADLSKRHDSIKMILAFLAVLCFILYQALGR
jgi:glycosylphosphatidylinositol transamidase (GPIT) subunit GPI8